jgi:hypothetical protein
MARQWAAAVVLTMAGINGAPAQDYPARTVTMIVPFAAGGPADVTARIVADIFTRHLGQKFVVENAVGAGGTVGTLRAARAAPDGYTILSGHMGTNALASAFYPNLGYDPQKDFEAIGLSAEFPEMLVVRKDFPANTLKEFIAYVFFPARANKLFSVYQHYESLEDVPTKLRAMIEENYFKNSFADIWKETRSDLERRGKLPEIARAESDRKYRMGLVFRWYFSYTTELALAGNASERVNFQVHVGPALGAFNQWVKGTALESWKSRHVDEIAEKIMTTTADYLQHRCKRLARQTALEPA